MMTSLRLRSLLFACLVSGQAFAVGSAQKRVILPSPAASPVPLTGLAVWLDGSKIATKTRIALFQNAGLTTPVVANADPVGGWTDLSPSRNDATQGTGANRPTYRTAVINSLPVVRFNGSTSVIPTSLLLPNHNLSVFVVYRGIGSVSGLASNTGAAPYNNFWFGVENPAAPVVYCYKGNGSTTDTLPGATLVSTATNYLCSMTLSANDYAQTFLNGSQEKSAAMAKQSNWTVSIGEITNRATNANIGEMLVYSRSVSTGERLQIEAYLAAKWGIILTTGLYTGVGSYKGSAPISGAANGVGTGAATSAEALIAGIPAHVRQAGTITRLRFYVQNKTNISSFVVKVWRKNGSTYDLVGTSENFLSKMAAAQNNTILLSSPITGVQEGDLLGYRVVWSGGQTNNFLTSTYSNVTTYTVLDATPGSTAYDWEAQTATSNSAVIIEPFMAGPYFAAIGDSLIAGHPANYSYIENTATFANASTIERHLSTLLGGASYQNMGVGSQTTTTIAARVALDLLDVAPRYAILEGGVNDISIGGANTQSVFIANWTLILDACRQNGIIPIVLKILPWTGGTNVQMQTRDTWNAALVTLAATYSAIVVDTSSYVGQFRGGGDVGNLWNIQAAYDAGDQVHLNDAGYAQVAAAIYAAMPH